MAAVGGQEVQHRADGLSGALHVGVEEPDECEVQLAAGEVTEGPVRVVGVTEALDGYLGLRGKPRTAVAKERPGRNL